MTLPFNLKTNFILLIIGLTLMLSACAQQGQQSQGEYSVTKTMVLDILQTEEGALAMEQSILHNRNQKQLLDTPELQRVIKQTLTDPENTDFLTKIMTDERFAGDFAKALIEENKDLHRYLVKDPEYQEGLLSILESPKFHEMIQQVWQSPEYRIYLVKLMHEAFQSPLFQQEMIDMLEKVYMEHGASEGQAGGGQTGGGQADGGEQDGNGDGGNGGEQTGGQ